MSALAFSDVSANPFANPIVTEPREVKYSVPELNDLALEILVTGFGVLETGPVPRKPVRAPLAHLVVSSDQGYGKSHLLGRLFRRLVERATRIYLRPFQDPQKAWHSILLTTIQELERTDDGGSENLSSPLQLESFASGVLNHLARACSSGPSSPLPAPCAGGPAASRCSGNAEPSRTGLLRDLGEEESFKHIKLQLDRARLGLRRSTRAWVKVLWHYVSSEPFSEHREAALRWLRAEPLEPQEVALLEFHPADNDALGEATAFQINSTSFDRLLDLCKLASFYRPFIFCFDQTEFYASDPELTRSLGTCVERLFAEVPNQMTVVTANLGQWLKDISTRMDPPQVDRFTSPIELEGITIKQSRELIRVRLESVGLDGRLEEFCSGNWLEPMFNQQQIGVRKLLVGAANRFDQLRRQKSIAQSIEETFNLKYNEVRVRKELQQYSQDNLMWFTQKLFAGSPSVSVGKLAGNRYFSTSWKSDQGLVFFAYEGADNSSRWRAIVKEAVSIATKTAPARCLVLRTPDLTKVPKPTWKQIGPELKAAEAKGFRIVSLTPLEVFEIHAAREFYSDALQGNCDFDPEEIRRWLQGRLGAWIERLSRSTAEPKPRPPESKQEITDQKLQDVIAYVSKHRFVSIDTVLPLVHPATRQALLDAIKQTPIKAHPGPKDIVLQWLERK